MKEQFHVPICLMRGGQTISIICTEPTATQPTLSHSVGLATQEKRLMYACNATQWWAALDQRILEATLLFLAQRGYAHMSLITSLSPSHTTRTTIYLRYPSKAVLTGAASVHARRSFVLPPSTGDLRQDLVAQLRRFQESVGRTL